MEGMLAKDIGAEIILKLKELCIILDKIKRERENAKELTLTCRCRNRIS